MDKDNLMDGVIPQPPIQSQSGVHELKSRLEWGEPAFTILMCVSGLHITTPHYGEPTTMDVLVDKPALL